MEKKIKSIEYIQSFQKQNLDTTVTYINPEKEYVSIGVAGKGISGTAKQINFPYNIIFHLKKIRLRLKINLFSV